MRHQAVRVVLRGQSVFLFMGWDGKIGRSREAGGNLLAGGVFDEKGAGPEEGVEAPNTLLGAVGGREWRFHFLRFYTNRFSS